MDEALVVVAKRREAIAVQKETKARELEIARARLLDDMQKEKDETDTQAKEEEAGSKHPLATGTPSSPVPSASEPPRSAPKSPTSGRSKTDAN